MGSFASVLSGWNVARGCLPLQHCLPPTCWNHSGTRYWQSAGLWYSSSCRSDMGALSKKKAQASKSYEAAPEPLMSEMACLHQVLGPELGQVR